MPGSLARLDVLGGECSAENMVRSFRSTRHKCRAYYRLTAGTTVNGRRPRPCIRLIPPINATHSLPTNVTPTQAAQPSGQRIYDNRRPNFLDLPTGGLLYWQHLSNA